MSKAFNPNSCLSKKYLSIFLKIPNSEIPEYHVEREINSCVVMVSI